MKTMYWSRFDTAVIVSMVMAMATFIGLSGEFEEPGTPPVAQVSRNLVVLHNPVETPHLIVADSATSLRLSGVSLALR